MTAADHRDAARGLLVGGAVGDALGVPYEFKYGRAIPTHPKMKGGGLGPYAPGEWSDDTQMAMAIALAGPDLQEIATNFVQWAKYDATDIGGQTAGVLRHVKTDDVDTLRKRARVVAKAKRGSAGNGALMRTGPVALFPEPLRWSKRIAYLTHADPQVAESVTLWVDAIARCIAGDELYLNVDVLPEDARARWSDWIARAETSRPTDFAATNGWTVSALLSAWSAIANTSTFADAVVLAVRGGGDTDTVAAIAGALAGAYYGLNAIPMCWVRDVHGLPTDMRAGDLISLADSYVQEAADVI